MSTPKVKANRKKRKIVDNPIRAESDEDQTDPSPRLKKKIKSTKLENKDKSHRIHAMKFVSTGSSDSNEDNNSSDEDMEYPHNPREKQPKSKHSVTTKLSQTKEFRERTTKTQSMGEKVISKPITKQKSETESDHGDSHSEADAEQSVDEEEQEMERIKAELSSMPFEELQKLKEKLGLKAFNQAMSKRSRPGAKRQFTRENKNRPREMSSKRPVPRFKPIFDIKEKVHRDPRFDDLSGEYDERLFKQSYSFIDDVKKREKIQIEKKMQKEKDPEKKAKMQYLVNRMSQQELASTTKSVRDEHETERRKQERALVKQGKTPFYLKNSEKRKLELADKYRDLKKSGKIEQYLVKKRKKNASKERKKLPNKH